MTPIEERVQRAAEILYDVGNKNGVPISKELAMDMAIALTWVAAELRAKGLKPGDIARHYRERYGEEPDSKQET
jgi:hypothetical protein